MGDDRIIPNYDISNMKIADDNQDFSSKFQFNLSHLLILPHCWLYLVSIAYINGKYFMQNDKGYTWRVLKSPKRYKGIRWKPEKLGKGDIIKLGRYIFEVKEISSKSVNKDRNDR